MQHGDREDVKQRSRRLRKAMTPPERRLWSVLKSRPDGFRFRKQHPCGPYTLDFFCPARGLAVEVDGEVHGRGDRPERDTIRDAWLAEKGLATLRVPAIELLRDLDAVVRYICDEAAGHPLHHRPAAGSPPPPQSGEGEA